MPLYRSDRMDGPVLDLFSLKGKIAAVTGGSRGIGLEVARGLAEAGADVAIIYHTSTDATQTAEHLASTTGVRVQAYQSDVTSRSMIRDTLEQIAVEFGHGKLDIVVANAGVCANVKALDYTEESWSFINGVNYDGAMWTAQATGRIFERQGHGNLIVTASVSSILCNTPQMQAAYNASKAAAAHLTSCLAVEWAGFARVNCVSPGYVETKMVTSQPQHLMDTWIAQIPGDRICHPRELRGVYIFLASDACPYMTGAQLFVDGGFSLV
ncbi:hypothetical protein LTR17_019857 [Elasticomyces elasticus]|nr:hypothetical protein LTR17_019857 [Elasticomyces elasticus]